jgi:hypothetical protein
MRGIAALVLAIGLVGGDAYADVPPVVGTWERDEPGPVLIYARRYQFRPDGSYIFTLTQRTRTSPEERTLRREAGTYRMETGNRLAMLPNAATPKSVSWRVEKARQLVLIQADGKLEIFFYRPQ